MSKQISFITDNINELLVQNRREILQMIYNSPSRSKLKEKGGGTQIKISELSDELINKILDFIKIKISEQTIVL